MASKAKAGTAFDAPFKIRLNKVLTTKVFWLKVLIHLGALLPLVNLYYLALTDRLSADPVEAVIHFTGIGALNLLMITLLVSPLSKYTRQSFLMKTRRLLGLYAFAYALLHLLNFLFFEVQFDIALFVGEIFKRPYITVGMAAFIILLSLALTSFDKVKRRMGKSWQKLHNLTYLAVPLAGIHFYWSVKSEIIEPGIYLVLILVLLSLRRDKFRRWFKR
ncbi:protein-methionine-sulfoxide reductase heme-binding subunit MsrQ [Thalassomonas viridans]|uniref:Protein-methionine-sulfoxide reductase heme-binding subunit MsrQ n=1 Tax=Thalassomonas viridans TaxID=137584 RepID=A0AAF0C8E2_9GAMM|nr:protein-methionine-sulfoxide reductase heme-binding subunit MsrQ [Thalassomonas viridans]WDE04110.1 protein-methionine-sulfoxide reductase heme-binding subunit MsrQ [Thalassomonas viridans]